MCALRIPFARLLQKKHVVFRSPPVSLSIRPPPHHQTNPLRPSLSLCDQVVYIPSLPRAGVLSSSRSHASDHREADVDKGAAVELLDAALPNSFLQVVVVGRPLLVLVLVVILVLALLVLVLRLLLP